MQYAQGTFVGRGQETFVGCVRRDSSVYLVVEAIVTEVIGTDARKALDERTGLVLLDLQGAK